MKKSPWSSRKLVVAGGGGGGGGGRFLDEELPAQFKCPISQMLMAEPVVVASGYSYERRCVEVWFQRGNRHCLKSGVVVEQAFLALNLNLQSLILDWCDKHQLAIPQPPSEELASELVELSVARAAPALVQVDMLDNSSESEHRYLTPGQSLSSSPSSPSGESFRELKKSSESSRSGGSGSSLQYSIFNQPSGAECPTSPMQFSSDTGRGGILMHVAPERLEEELLEKLHHRHVIEQEEGAVEIRRLARNTDPSVDYRAILCTPRVLEALVSLMQSHTPRVQTNAIAAVLNLSLANDNKIKITRAAAIPKLVEVLKSDGTEAAAKESATGALFSLAINGENRKAIGALGAIPPLVDVLRVGSSSEACRRDALMALYHLSLAQNNRGKLIKAGAVRILLELLQKENTADLMSCALLILYKLASRREGLSAISEGNGIAVLISLIASCESSPNPLDLSDGGDDNFNREDDDWASVQEHAAAALALLSEHNVHFKGQALQAGALKPLTALAQQGTQRARDKATFLLNILCTDRKLSDAGNAPLYAPALYGRKAAEIIRCGSDDFDVS